MANTEKKYRWMACIVGCVLLVGVQLDYRLLHAAARNADDYHTRIRFAADQIPNHVGDWVSEEAPVLPAAVALLRPNVVMGRRYRNLSNGLAATLLLVQCRDARDLVGHYPPVCYPAHGWQLVSHNTEQHSTGPLQINGALYEFSSANIAVKGTMKVYDFMILPSGRTTPSMDDVYKIAGNRVERYFGAAQIQIVMDGSLSDEDRNQIINTLLDCARPAIDAIREGAKQ